MKKWFGIDLKKFGNNFINWTMTYRRDTDVPCPYSEWVRFHLGSKKEEEEKIEKIVSSKSRDAVSLINNKKLIFS